MKRVHPARAHTHPYTPGQVFSLSLALPFRGANYGTRAAVRSIDAADVRCSRTPLTLDALLSGESGIRVTPRGTSFPDASIGGHTCGGLLQWAITGAAGNRSTHLHAECSGIERMNQCFREAYARVNCAVRALARRWIGPHARLDSNCGQAFNAASTRSCMRAHPPEGLADGRRALFS